VLTRILAHLRDSLFRNTYILVAMRIFGAGTGVLFWMLAARSMPASEVGIASGAVSAATLLAGLAQLGLGYGLVRHFTASQSPSALINFAMLICGLVSLGLALIFLVVIPWWSPNLLPLRADAWMALVTLLLVVTTALSQLIHWVFLAARRLDFSLWKMVIQSIAAIALLLALRPFMSGFGATVIAYMLSTVVGLAPSFWPLLPKAHPAYRFFLTLRPADRTAFAGYSLANYAADQLNRAPDSLLHLLVISVLGPSAGAYFFVVWTFGRSLSAWAGSMAESFFAEASHDPTKTDQHLGRSMRGGLALSAGMMLAAIVLGAPVLALYGWDYVQNGFPLLVAVVLATIPTVLLYIFVNIWRVRNQLNRVLLVTFLSVGSGITFSLIGAHWAGLTGAGIGWAASQWLAWLGVTAWQRIQHNSTAHPTKVPR
jgi:O-antigen/teichoic acid export membrane protein